MTTTVTVTTTDKKPPFLIRHPWLLVFAAFALLITAWTALITIAVEHAPQQVEVKTTPADR